MTRQILIINITRMGDLVQMGALLDRIQREWPGAAVDLVVDQRFAPVAGLLPHLRQVIAYDFHALVDEARVNARDLVALYRDMAVWALPLAEAGYDRIINLTFDKRSGLLAAYIGARDMRGVAAARDGRVGIHNDWMAYLTDMHHYRRYNRFNLADIYAWGGSGEGPFAPLSFVVPAAATEWAQQLLRRQGNVHSWIAVQVGASDTMKAWRPELFGRTLTHLTRRSALGIVVIGASQEQEAIQEAIRWYRGEKGKGILLDVAGRTDVIQLAALLSACRLLLTNDTGPMHFSVAVGTPVVDLSVGHVDFRETGPYGPGHWVVQPDLHCAPCGFDQVCAHHACKDRILPEDMAALCLHALGNGPLPHHPNGIRLYQSAVDQDGLATYHLRAGREDALGAWYGAFWRAVWFEAFTGRRSACPGPVGAPPDVKEALDVIQSLIPMATRLMSRAQMLVRLTTRRPIAAAAMKEAQREEERERGAALARSVSSPASHPLAIALLRDLQNDDGSTLTEMARSRLETYRRWHTRLLLIRSRLENVARAEGPFHKRELPVYPAA